MTTATVKDRSDQSSTGRLAWGLVRSLTRDLWRAIKWVGPRRRELNTVLAVICYALASTLWPWPTFLLSLVAPYVAWRTAPGQALRMEWALRGDRKYDAFVTAIFQMSGVGIVPRIRRDCKGRAEVHVTERSWTFQLLAPQGGAGKTASELCRMWPRLKNEIGQGCIAVNLHERTGNHLTMVVVFQRFEGERAVRISRDRLIIVHGTRRFPDLVRNPSLDGWVRAEYRHASEWHGTEDAEIAPELDPRDRMWGDDKDERDEVEEVDASQDGTSEVAAAAPYEPPTAPATWTPKPQVMEPETDIHSRGVGEAPLTTPPVVDLDDDPFLAPPTTPMISAGLFAPKIHSRTFRPTGANVGTATGDLWDLVQTGPPRTTRELADLAGLTPGSAGNALSRWRKLGFIGGDDGRWLMIERVIATVAPDGEQETG